MPKVIPIELIGKSFGRLTILEILHSEGSKGYLVLAKCECNKIKTYCLNSLRGGRTRSCGCLRTDSNLTGNNRRSHGLKEHHLYEVWGGMKKRCYNKKGKQYKNYGGRGVTVCLEWRNDFKTFYDWAISNGWEKGLQIDKDKLSPYKTGLLYSPEYCCFLTRKENMRYRSISTIIRYKNEEKCLSEWCEIFNISVTTVIMRIKRGWGINESFEVPVKTKSIMS